MDAHSGTRIVYLKGCLAPYSIIIIVITIIVLLYKYVRITYGTLDAGNAYRHAEEKKD